MIRYLITVGRFGFCYHYAENLSAAASLAQEKFGSLLTAVVQDTNNRHPRTHPHIRPMWAFPCPLRLVEEKEAA